MFSHWLSNSEDVLVNASGSIHYYLCLLVGSIGCYHNLIFPPGGGSYSSSNMGGAGESPGLSVKFELNDTGYTCTQLSHNYIIMLCYLTISPLHRINVLFLMGSMVIWLNTEQNKMSRTVANWVRWVQYCFLLSATSWHHKSTHQVTSISSACCMHGAVHINSSHISCTWPTTYH